MSKYGFAGMEPDSRRIACMEWIVEGVALVSTGAYVIVATAIDSSTTVSAGVHIRGCRPVRGPRRFRPHADHPRIWRAGNGLE
jgi:hypothetical protein